MTDRLDFNIHLYFSAIFLVWLAVYNNTPCNQFIGLKRKHYTSCEWRKEAIQERETKTMCKQAYMKYNRLKKRHKKNKDDV